MSTKVLVTGATGFIGQHVVRVLSEKGYIVHAITSGEPRTDLPVTIWHRKNLLDDQSLATLLQEQRPELLIHLAWHVKPGSYSGGENIRWVQATLQLMCDYYETLGSDGRMIVAGSGFEYDRNHGYCSEETTPLNPDSYYGKCKNATRQLFEAYIDENQLSGAWGRIFNVYGPAEAPNRLVSSVILSLLKNERVSCSDGIQYRDYLHVYDVAEAIVAIAASNELNGAINIGSGQPIQVKRIVELIASYFSETSDIGFGDIQSSEKDLPLTVADIRRLSTEIGFEPTYSIEDGLIQTIEWWKSH